MQAKNYDVLIEAGVPPLIKVDSWGWQVCTEYGANKMKMRE
jgi:hypothetical protein